jgi:hypothetical protein
MHKRWDDAARGLRKRLLLVPVILLAAAAGLVFVLRLSQYPADQAASLRQRVEGASLAELPLKDSLTLEKDLMQYETDNRIKIWTAIVQAVGGAVLLVGLFFTWRNLRATQLKLDIDREGQLTNRFTQATTQLGAQLGDGMPNVAARLGGIYALEWIARDSPPDYWPVMEVLTAYVRHNASSAQGTFSPQGQPGEPKPRTDIQAVLTILGRSKPPQATERRLDQKFDLRSTDLRGAEFWDAHMERTDFWGANLQGANLWGSFLNDAKLVKAHLQRAILKGVIFTGADLTDAELDGADLEGADLTKAKGLTREQVESAKEGGRGGLLPAFLRDPNKRESG